MSKNYLYKTPMCLVLMGVLLIVALWAATPRVENARQDDSQFGQTYRADSTNGQKRSVNLVLEYKSWQNPIFTFELRDGCIKELFIKSATGEKQRVSKAPRCRKTRENLKFRTKTTIDLQDYLAEGKNNLNFVFDNKCKSCVFYFSAALFDGHLLSSAITMGIFIVTAIMLMFFLERLKFDNIARWMVLIAMFYVLFWLQYRPNTFVTNDFWGHLEYIEHMDAHFWSPYSYMGQENWHPPFFYGVAALIDSAFERSFLNPITIIRIISSVSYMLFVIYGLRTLQISYAPRNFIYYIGCVLIVFWPGSIVLATNLTHDMIVSTIWAAIFYYLVKWYNSASKELPYAAIALAGLAFLVKSNAIVPTVIVAFCVLSTLVDKRIKWGVFLKSRAIYSLGFLMSGIVLNAGKLIYYYFRGQNRLSVHSGLRGGVPLDLEHFFTIKYADFVLNPFVSLVRHHPEPTFWNFFLKTTLYGEFPYYHTVLAQILNVILLALVFLAVVFMVLLFITRLNNKKLLPHAVAIVVIIGFMFVFMMVNRVYVAQEFRFCLPLLIPFVILYVRGLAEAQQRCTILYIFAVFVAIALPLLGTIFYLSQPFGFGS